MRLATGILLLAVVAAGEPASAQRKSENENGSRITVPMRARIPTAPSLSKAEAGRIVMAQFARCVIDREYRKVERAIALTSLREFNWSVAAIVSQDCLARGQIRFKPVVIRGPLFAELYRRKSLASERGQSWGPSAPPINFKVDRAALHPEEKAHLGMLAFGKCVADAQPESAKAMVRAKTESADQDAVFAKLVPSFSECIHEGVTIRLSRQAVEAVLAEVLYRGVEAPVARSMVGIN